MTNHVGNCDICQKTGVRIAYGWSTRSGRHCIGCNRNRLSAKKKAAPKRVFETYKTGTPCFECGSTKKKLDHSHILSVGAHPELANDHENIVPHCRGCHRRWEFGKRNGMRTLLLKRAYMEQHTIVKLWT